ncbi:hypothetical protein GGQ64_004765 [Rhizobium azooxidifex]|uniref:Uncharacterized protein n=1 Tax=Mycoplana azooxidifex TaxID=1636188 RepID=A0A7W6DA80_9HYPH|nr:hypothetical protein [Mycoplana azooxidifex]MBB3979521.1 hypothetical protein [Mycoplana azooxidifex]
MSAAYVRRPVEPHFSDSDAVGLSNTSAPTSLNIEIQRLRIDPTAKKLSNEQEANDAMYIETVEKFAAVDQHKVDIIRNHLRALFIGAMMAGAYIGSATSSYSRRERIPDHRIRRYGL